MMNEVMLDDAATYTKYDPSEMGKRIRELPTAILDAWQAAINFELPDDFKGVVRPNFDTLYSVAWLDLTSFEQHVSFSFVGAVAATVRCGASPDCRAAIGRQVKKFDQPRSRPLRVVLDWYWSGFL